MARKCSETGPTSTTLTPHSGQSVGRWGRSAEREVNVRASNLRTPPADPNIERQGARVGPVCQWSRPSTDRARTRQLDSGRATHFDRVQPTEAPRRPPP